MKKIKIEEYEVRATRPSFQDGCKDETVKEKRYRLRIGNLILEDHFRSKLSAEIVRREKYTQSGIHKELKNIAKRYTEVKKKIQRKFMLELKNAHRRAELLTKLKD